MIEKLRGAISTFLKETGRLDQIIIIIQFNKNMFLFCWAMYSDSDSEYFLFR